MDENSHKSEPHLSKHDMTTQQKFIELRAQGHSFVNIASKLNVLKQTLINWSKELQAEIANQKAIELEQLQQQYFMTRSAKIEMLGELLIKTRNEVLNRDLSDGAHWEARGDASGALKRLGQRERSALTFQSRKSGISSGLVEFFEEKVTEWSA